MGVYSEIAPHPSNTFFLFPIIVGVSLLLAALDGEGPDDRCVGKNFRTEENTVLSPHFRPIAIIALSRRLPDY